MIAVRRSLRLAQKLGKTLEQKRQTSPRKLVTQRTKIENLHDGAPRINAPRNHTTPSIQSPIAKRVNLTSERRCFA